MNINIVSSTNLWIGQSPSAHFSQGYVYSAFEVWVVRCSISKLHPLYPDDTVFFLRSLVVITAQHFSQLALVYSNLYTKSLYYNHPFSTEKCP